MSRIPLVTNIARGRFEDGPGVRSVVFFKGCPLTCLFCHNPETQRFEREIAFTRSTCVNCEACVTACPRNAIDTADPVRIRRSRCDLCGACADVCPSSALRMVGRTYTPEDLADLLLRDLPFYRHSGGGVTLSGGEATAHPSYLERLLPILRSSGVSVVLETCGYFNYSTFQRRVLPYLDLIYFDVKFADSAEHKRYTGVGNKRILSNLRRLIRDDRASVRPRIPIVPGVTDTEANLSGLVAALRDAGADTVTLLPYNPLGIEKHQSLGRPTPPLSVSFMKPEDERRAFEIVSRARARGRTPAQ